MSHVYPEICTLKTYISAHCWLDCEFEISLYIILMVVLYITHQQLLVARSEVILIELLLMYAVLHEDRMVGNTPGVAACGAFSALFVRFC
jgi:hypothetical protein